MNQILTKLTKKEINLKIREFQKFEDQKFCYATTFRVEQWNQNILNNILDFPKKKLEWEKNR